MTTIYDFTPAALDGAPKPLADFRGKVLLIVNVASKCGFTGQYAGLEALHRRFGVPASTRASFHVHSGTDDVDALVDAVQQGQRFFGVRP